MDVSAIKLTNQKNNFGKSTGVEQLTKAAKAVNSADKLDINTVSNVADCLDGDSSSPKSTRLLKYFLTSLVAAAATYGTVRAASGRLYTYIDEKVQLPVFDFIGKKAQSGYQALRKRVAPTTERSCKAIVQNSTDKMLNWAKNFAQKSVSKGALDGLTPTEASQFMAKKGVIKACSSITGALAAMNSVKATTRDKNGDNIPDLFQNNVKKETPASSVVNAAVQAASLITD